MIRRFLFTELAQLAVMQHSSTRKRRAHCQLFPEFLKSWRYSGIAVQMMAAEPGALAVRIATQGRALRKTGRKWPATSSPASRFRLLSDDHKRDAPHHSSLAALLR
jgi:hypothetical protein